MKYIIIIIIIIIIINVFKMVETGSHRIWLIVKAAVDVIEKANVR